MSVRRRRSPRNESPSPQPTPRSWSRCSKCVATTTRFTKACAASAGAAERPTLVLAHPVGRPLFRERGKPLRDDLSQAQRFKPSFAVSEIPLGIESCRERPHYILRTSGEVQSHMSAKIPYDGINAAYAVIVHAVFAFLGWFIFAKGDVEAGALNIAVQGLGIVIGFWVGMFVSPISTRQRADLSTVGKTITAFASGYLLSKLDPVVTTWLSKPHEIDRLTAFRIIAFSSSLLAQATSISLFDWYKARPMPDDQPPG
jgi:hypothetical protein